MDVLSETSGMSDSSEPKMKTGDIICPDCGTRNSAERFVCSECRASLSANNRMSTEWLHRWGWVSAITAYLFFLPALPALALALRLYGRETRAALKIAAVSLGAVIAWGAFWAL